MKGQRGFSDSFSETIDIDEGFVSNNIGVSEQPSWNNILNPVQSRLSNHAGFSDEAVCTNGIGDDVQSFRGRDAGEPSSGLNPQNRIDDDGMKMEQGWPSSFDPRSEERRSEPTNIIFPGRVNIGSSSNQVSRRPIFLQSSSSSPHNVNRIGRSEMEHVGASSGSSGYIEESNGGASSSLGSWGLSYKRKALEGTSRQSYAGGSSSTFPQAENFGWPTRTSSVSLSTPSWNSSSVGPPEHLNSRFGVSMTEAPSNVFPVNPLRSFGQRVNQGTQQDSIPFTLSSPRPICSGDSSGSRAATVVAGNSSASLGQSTGLSRNLHHFHSRASSSSSHLMPGDRGSPLLEEPYSRTLSRNNVDHLGQNSRTYISNPGHIPSSSRYVPSSSFPIPTWTAQHNAPTQDLRRLPDFSPWSLFSSIDPESGGPSRAFPQFSPGPSASSQETAMPSSLSQSHHQPYPRHRDDVLGPRSLRALAVDIECRHRLISQIRQVLSAMRRGENLQAEDLMLLDQFVYHGMADMHDRHRDMRLDVDNMSYEELLALGERIGDVSTGLSEETILKSMKQCKFISVVTTDLEPCSICQDDYGDGEDVGTLDCGHDFHTNCIKQWLMQKNLCPICKTKALQT